MNVNKNQSTLYWIPSQLPDDPQKLAEIRPDTPEWASQELHLFIVTDAGKPIYTRYGTIPTVSPIMCSWYAICSLMESLHEELDHFRAGSSTFVFLRKQSFIFIAVSKSALPVTCLFKQLNYLYLLFLSLFSEYVLTQISQKPSIDFRLYAEPNRPTWNGVINNMSEDPAFIFVPSIPVSNVRPQIRQLFSRSPSFSRLQSCKLSMLIKKNRVVAFGPHICDTISLRLIIDLVWTPVFRDEEHWVPLYLRDSNKTNFLFTHNLKGTDYFIVMLCGNQEMDTYHSVSVSLFSEVFGKERREIVAQPVGAPDIFLCWALNSLTYGQVFVTDPDQRVYGDAFMRRASVGGRRSGQIYPQNLSPRNQAPGGRNENQAATNANTNEIHVDNQAGNHDNTASANPNDNNDPNQNSDQNSTQNNDQNTNQNIPQNIDQPEITNQNSNSNEIQIQNSNQNIPQNAEQPEISNQNSNSNETQAQNSNQNTDHPQISDQISTSNSVHAHFSDQSIPQNTDNPQFSTLNSNANETQSQASDQISSQNSQQGPKKPKGKNCVRLCRKPPRERLRELYRQLAKSCDMVESNGSDGEYMFRGEKEVIVAYKNKEMELYAIARNEDLPDSLISEKLGKLREFVNAHINELLITDTKFAPEKFA